MTRIFEDILMIEHSLQQLNAAFLLPAFYVAVPAAFIFGLRAGWAFRDLALVIAIVVVSIGQAINSSTLPFFILSASCSTFALGMLIAYFPIWINKTFLKLY